MAGKTEIGALNVKLTAEANEFNKAVDRAGIKLHELAKQGSRVGGAAGGGGMFGGALSGAAGGFVGGAAAGGAVGLAIEGIKMQLKMYTALQETVLGAGRAWHETSEKAREFGISTRAVVGMTILARDRGDEWETGLMRLQKEIGEAAGGSKESQAKFEALGLSWKDLEAVPLDQAAGRVNDAINKSGTAAAKGAAAFEIYGRAGQRLLRVIERAGSKGIDAAQLEALNRGLVADPAATKVFEERAEAMRQLGREWESFKGKLAVAAIPAVRAGNAFQHDLDDTLMTWFGRKTSPAELANLQAGEAAKAAAGAKAQAAQREIAAATKSLVAARELNVQLATKVATEGVAAEQAAVYESRAKAGAAATKQISDAWQKAAAAQQGALEKQEQIRRDADLLIRR